MWSCHSLIVDNWISVAQNINNKPATAMPLCCTASCSIWKSTHQRTTESPSGTWRGWETDHTNNTPVRVGIINCQHTAFSLLLPASPFVWQVSLPSAESPKRTPGKPRIYAHRQQYRSENRHAVERVIAVTSPGSTLGTLRLCSCYCWCRWCCCCCNSIYLSVFPFFRYISWRKYNHLRGKKRSVRLPSTSSLEQ